MRTFSAWNTPSDSKEAIMRRASGLIPAIWTLNPPDKPGGSAD